MCSKLTRQQRDLLQDISSPQCVIVQKETNSHVMPHSSAEIVHLFIKVTRSDLLGRIKKANRWYFRVMTEAVHRPRRSKRRCTCKHARTVFQKHDIMSSICTFFSSYTCFSDETITTEKCWIVICNYFNYSDFIKIKKM